MASAANPNKRPPLTKELLYSRALQIADSEGLAALTMRRLAADVGVEAASLYHHIPNKDALLDGVAISMRRDIVVPDPLPEDWRELMVVIFMEYYRMLDSHPNLISLAGRRVETDPDSGLVYLTSLGLSPDDAVELWQSITALVVGFSVFSSSYAESDVSDLPGELAARMTDWREETVRRSLYALIEAYDGTADA